MSASFHEWYGNYPSVDEAKRALLELRDDVLAAAPELQRFARSELAHRVSSGDYLCFTARGRACEVSFHGNNQLPDATFWWGDDQLFQFQPIDSSQLAAVLKRWLGDQSPLSAMRKEFTWLELEEVADSFENGNPLEASFVQSWDFIEDYFSEDWCTFTGAVLNVIHAMRAAGYDRVLRADQSMRSLVLSRSRRQGFRMGQALVWFDFHEELMDVHARFAGESLKGHPREFTEDVRRLLDALAELDIE